MPTCSLVIHKKVFSNVPYWFITIAPVQDYFMQILGSLDKGALYIPDCTIVYRIDAVNSWSVRTKRANAEYRVNYMCKIIYCLEQIDIMTNYKYSDSFQRAIALNYLLCALEYLSESNYIEVNKFIDLSWKAKKNLNYRQFILKRFIKLSPLINKYKALKNYIKFRRQNF